MDDDNRRGNQRRRARDQIDGEDYHKRNRRRRTNPLVVTNEPLNDGARADDDDNGIGGNQRKRARQIDGEDDWTTNRRGQTNQLMVMNEPQNDGAHARDDYDAGLDPLSLTLGPPSYSPLIPPMTSSPLRLASPSPVAPPMMATWSPNYFLPLLASSQSYFTTPPSYLASSTLSNSLFQTGSQGSSTPMQPPFEPSFNVLSSSNLAPPSNETPARPVMTPIASAVETRRSYRSKSSGNQKDDTIPPPFPWATNKRGCIESLENLESKQITTITGDVQCKHCGKVYKLSYNLREKFLEVKNIFVMRKRIMRERAPRNWINPELMRCEHCGHDKAVKPALAKRKSQINWLFLLLGQMLGHCTLDQLKNFCKHSKNHRTGAKDRVLYLTYLGLCKMLEPNRELFSCETLKIVPNT